ncbi:MAG: DUF192 domain-containing protein [bacterium]|nr:DUF192 domain-containing protein [bacterium]
MSRKVIIIASSILVLFCAILALIFVVPWFSIGHDRAFSQQPIDISNAYVPGQVFRDPDPLILPSKGALSKSEIRIKGVSYRVDVMNTDETREQGLSGRESLPDGTGMLFVFDQPDRYGFWMKDMKFAIDMLWLDEQGKVVFSVPNAQPSSYPAVFTPPSVSAYVVELPAGEVKKAGIGKGDIFDLSDIVRHN